MGKPFKINQPAGGNGPGRSPGPNNPASTLKKAHDEGVTMVEAAVEDAMPDHEIGDGEIERMDGDGARPVFPPANPWPAAKPVQNKPFR